MIRHIVFFTARNPEQTDALVAGLSVLTGIPTARRVEIGRSVKVDQIANEVDVVVYAEFDSDSDLAAYKAHPFYAEAIRRARPLRETRIAADYRTEEAVLQPVETA